MKLSFEISLIRFLIGILKITFQLNSSLALFLTGYTTLNKIYKKRSGMSRSKSLLCSKCILLGIVFAWWVFSVHVLFFTCLPCLKREFYRSVRYSQLWLTCKSPYNQPGIVPLSRPNYYWEGENTNKSRETDKGKLF